MTDQELHSQVVTDVIDRLKNSPTVTALFGDRIGTAPPAGEPRIVVSAGKMWPAPESKIKSRQVDVRVKVVTPDRGFLPAGCVAVQTHLTTLNRSGVVKQCVLMDTGSFEEEDGEHFRRDVFACFV